jgi:hypothetical protein
MRWPFPCDQVRPQTTLVPRPDFKTMRKHAALTIQRFKIDTDQPMLKKLAGMLLLINPCLSSAMPPSLDSPPYVPPPTFIDDPDRDDPGSANHLLQGIWETSSDTDHFAFEIKLLKFRVLGSNCDWIHWEWVTATEELLDGEIVLTRLTIRAVAESGENPCLRVPMPIYIDFGAPLKYDVAKVKLGAGWSDERDVLMTRHAP